MAHDEDREPPALPLALLRLLLPAAERAEVLEELRVEYAERTRVEGAGAARRRLWREVYASAPRLAARGWWRGWNDFQPRANRWQPGGAMFESTGRDLRYALRRLRRHPLYTLLAVLTLSLGVAGTAAVFSIARQFLLEPLPVRAEQEVAVFWAQQSWSDEEFVALRPEVDGFEHLAAYRPLDLGFREGDGPTRLIPAIYGTAELFDVLGVRPLMGPGFQPGDDVQGTEPVAVIGHALWRELGGDPGLVGETLELSGFSFTVAGVMPPGFWFPEPRVQVWLAHQLNPSNQSGRHTLIGRLPAGGSVGAMGGPLERITMLLRERFEYPAEWDKTQGAELTPVREFLMGPLRPALLALLAAMAVILLIACVNVAALMLGQVEGRGTEMAVRSALGAGRQRLLQGVVLEALVVGALAGLAGTVLASVAFRVVREALPLGALADNAVLDGWLIFGGVGFALVAATLVALVPALSVAGGDPQARLTRARTGGVAGRGGRLESALVVIQVALVLVMTSGAALLIRSVGNLRAIHAGVETRGVGVVDVLLPASLDQAERRAALGEMVRAVGERPGVEAAAAVQRLPLRGPGDNWGIEVDGRPDLESATTVFRMVTPDHFRTHGIRVLSGRTFLETDRLDMEEPPVVVNQALADRFLPGVDPLGARISHGGAWFRVVGVVDDVAEAYLSPVAEPARYILYEHSPFIQTGHSIAFRTRGGGDPVASLDAVRRVLQGVAPGVAIRETTTMKSVFDRAIGPARQVMMLLSLLGGLALALGVVGVYGVVAHFVARRRREWAVRMALGQHPRRVIGQIVARGGRLVAGGIVLGLAAFLAIARILASFLYEVGSADPLALAGATLLLLAAGLLAASVPAWRTSRIDPALVLREQ